MKQVLILTLLGLADSSHAQEGLLIDSLNNTSFYAPPKLLKTHGIRYVREDYIVFGDTLTFRVFLIDTTGQTKTCIVYHSRQGGVQDSTVYNYDIPVKVDTERLVSMNSDDVRSLSLYRYATKDSIESLGKIIKNGNRRDTVLLFTRLNAELLPVEKKTTDAHLTPLTTSTYTYNYAGAKKSRKNVTIDHRNPGAGYTSYTECEYNLNRCTSCISLVGDKKNTVNYFRYNNDGLLAEWQEDQYDRDHVIPVTHRFYYSK